MRVQTKLDLRGEGPSLNEPKTLDIKVPEGRVPTAAEIKAMEKAMRDTMASIGKTASWLHNIKGNPDKLPTTSEAYAMFPEADLQFRYDHKSEETHYGEGGVEMRSAYDDHRQGSGVGRIGNFPVLEINVGTGRFTAKVPYKHIGDNEDKVKWNNRQQHWQAGRKTLDHKMEGSRPLDVPLEDVQDLQQGKRGGEILFGGVLPADGVLKGSQTYKARAAANDFNIPVTVTLTYQFSPFPPEEIELLILPPKGYSDWRPAGGKDEKTAADERLRVEVKVQKKGGGAPKRKVVAIHYRLVGTSKEKGVCMNWPPKGQAKGSFDYAFEEERNPDFDIGDDGQTARHQGDNLLQDRVEVSSFDYGGWCDLQVEGELDNGQRIEGRVDGKRNLYRLPIPERDSGSHIAISFLKKHGALSQEDDSDDEDKPAGDGFNGDGLTLYEEYRGFVAGERAVITADGTSAGVSQDWTAGNPQKKDLFVLNGVPDNPFSWRGIEVYRAATGLDVHPRLQPHQVGDDRVINFNRTAGAHLADQHAMEIKSGATSDGAAYVDTCGPPGVAGPVHMPIGWELYRPRSGERLIPSFERTLAHEMLHASNVNHHGDSDFKAQWILVDIPTPHVVENRKRLFYDSSAGGYRTEEVTGTVVNVLREDGSPVPLKDIFPGNSKVRTAIVSLPQGQHSGAEDCLMRYWVSTAYMTSESSRDRYLTGDEVRGDTICGTLAGTGVNSAGRSPRSRHGDASGPNARYGIAKQRGGCRHLFRINDRGGAAPR